MKKWELKSEYSYYGISAKAFRSVHAKFSDEFEIGIFFASFESRALTSSESLLKKNSFKYSVIVFFDEAKNTELRKKYDELLLSQVQECSINDVIQLRDISIKNIYKSLKKILISIPNKCLTLDANWFLDLGGCPTPYFLGIMGFLRDTFPRPKLTLFNPTGFYSDNVEEFTFTSGFDKNIWIPRLWGRPDPNADRTYIFLLGFDGERSYEVFYRCEPDKVRAIVGYPGYELEYSDVPLKKNELFLKASGLFEEPLSPKVVRSNAADPIETWQKLKIIVSDIGISNIVFVPIGPKAHALACGLFALTDNVPSVLYHLPRTYSIRDVTRGKFIWKYEITL